MSTSFKNVTLLDRGTATLLIVLSTGFLLLTQSLFVVPSGQVAVTTLGKVSGPSESWFEFQTSFYSISLPIRY